MKEKDAAKLMPFGKTNYRILIAAVITFSIGLVIMTLDGEEFGFGFLGITLGPLVVFAGFVLGFVSLLTKPKRVIAEESITSSQPKATAKPTPKAPAKSHKKKTARKGKA